MSSSPENHEIMTCAACGAVIYTEHVNRGLAGYRNGNLLCPHCLAETKDTTTELSPDEERLSLVDETELTDRTGLTTVPGQDSTVTTGKDYEFKRAANPPDKPATRCKVFHAKLSEGAVRHLEEMVNEWIDEHPEVHVKHSSTNVGQWEGKHAENHLIITIFY